MISIFLEDLLSKQSISVSALSRRSGVPYSTTHELVHGKKALEKAAAETVYRISRVLDVSMEELVIGALRDKAWNTKTKPTDE